MHLSFWVALLQKQKTFPKKNVPHFQNTKSKYIKRPIGCFYNTEIISLFHVSCNHSVQSMLVQNEGYNGLQELESPDEIKRAKTSVSVRYGAYTIVMDIRTTVECNAVVMSLFMVIQLVFFRRRKNVPRGTFFVFVAVCTKRRIFLGVPGNIEFPNLSAFGLL